MAESPVEAQIKTNYESLSGLLQEMKLFLQDPESNTPPSYAGVVSSVGYDDLLTAIKNRIMDNPSFSAAIMQEEVSKIEALYREFLIRNFSKRDYFDNAESGVDRELEYLSSERTRAINYLLGKMSIQGGS